MHDFITEFKPDFADDEIDLGELFTALWRGKWLIFSLCCVALMLASLYLRGAERKYTVSMTFKPVIADNFGPNLAGFGGLASLAILVGLLPGVFLLDDQARQLGLWMLISSIPVFLGGSGEDIGLDIKPLQRLLASLVSAALAVVLFGYLVPYVATCLL